MKKYIWFFMGYVAALMSILLVSCTYSPLQANFDTPGHSTTFPLYVKVVE